MLCRPTSVAPADEPAHLGVDIDGAEIQVHPVLAGRGIVHLLEAQPGAVGPDDGYEFAGYQFLLSHLRTAAPTIRRAVRGRRSRR